MYNFYNQPYQYNQPQFTVKQVTSIDEAKASIIDPLSTNLYIDFNTGKIYMKRLNNNGMSDFYTFAVEQNVAPAKDPLQIINDRLTNIENKLGGLNDKSVSANADKSHANDKSADVSANATQQSTIS